VSLRDLPKREHSPNGDDVLGAFAFGFQHVKLFGLRIERVESFIINLFALIALIVFVIRIPLLLVASSLRTFARLRSFGFNEALKKISPTVTENLAGPFSKRNGSLHVCMHH
jgi:hypothetical protein